MLYYAVVASFYNVNYHMFNDKTLKDCSGTNFVITLEKGGKKEMRTRNFVSDF